jgi:hypothetical protein
MTNLISTATTVPAASALSRRTVLQSAVAGALVISPALRSMAYAAGSDAPEKTNRLRQRGHGVCFRYR